jgi:hypothetical protein
MMIMMIIIILIDDVVNKDGTNNNNDLVDGIEIMIRMIMVDSRITTYENSFYVKFTVL